jgi:hypothetical protein
MALLAVVLMVCCVGTVSAYFTPLGVLQNNATYLNITTYEGSGEVVHPSVIYTDMAWNGYHYLMAMTPYPEGSAAYEDPSMRYSNDKITWTMIQGQPDPIVPTPEVGFNSDPNIVLAGTRLYLFYRWAADTTPTLLYCNFTTTTDGVTWTTPVTTDLPYMRSQSFAYENGQWTAYGHNLTTNNIEYRYTSSDAQHWTQNGNVSFSNIVPQWHSDIKKYDGIWQALITSTTRGYFFYSYDGLTFIQPTESPVLSGVPGEWDQSIYKSSFVKIGNEYDVWYNGNNATSGMRVGYATYNNTCSRPMVLGGYFYDDYSCKSDGGYSYNNAFWDNSHLVLNHTGSLDVNTAGRAVVPIKYGYGNYSIDFLANQSSYRAFFGYGAEKFTTGYSLGANGYFVIVRGNTTNTVSLYKRVAGSGTQLTSDAYTFLPNTWYNLKVIWQPTSPRMQLFVNGTLITTSDDSTYTSSGYAGAYVRYDIEDKVIYDNLLIQENMTPVISQFTPSGPQSIWYPNGIAFRDTSTGSPTSWDWNWGDGTHCYTQNCYKVWYGPGVYTVSLNASNTYSYSINSTVVQVMRS